MGRLFLDPVVVGIIAKTSDGGVEVGAVTFTQGLFTLFGKDMVEGVASVTFTCDNMGTLSGESDSASGSRGGRNVEVEVAVKTEGKTARVAYAAGASWKGSIDIEGGAVALKVKITGADLSIKRSKTGTWVCRCFDKDGNPMHESSL
jgi:hypothetical protein